jgi:hypothetical protein
MDPLNHHNIIIQGECRHINDGSRIIKVKKVTVDKLATHLDSKEMGQ